MRKPSFGVVTGVVVVLAIIAFISRLVVDLIPGGPENRLASESAEFLLQASHEQIDWHPLAEESFQDARRPVEKPILLVLGSSCSPIGRAADKLIFQAKEVRGYLARNFICIRVDTMARPEFQNAFWPILRAVVADHSRLAIPPDFQVWFLDPRGNVYGYAAELTAGQMDPRSFLARLEDAADRFEKLQDLPKAAGVEQRRDLETIEAATPPQLPDLPLYGSDLYRMIGVSGGLPVNGLQRLWPSAWQFQLMAGRYDGFSKSIDPCLSSPLVDVIDGGFFTDPADMDWRGNGYDKLAVTNAAMMQTLAAGSILLNEPRQRWLAIHTFDALLNEFVHGGFIAAGQIGDDSPLGRSQRYSFSPRRLRALFPNDGDREWVRQNLGLRVESNPQMTPLLSSLDPLTKDPKRFGEAVNTLRQGRLDPSFAGLALLDVGGFCTARMMQSARILGDHDRLVQSEQLFESLDDFRSLNDVVHSRGNERGSYAYLGDYLAYADGALQYFLATGNAPMLAHGVAVLRRGLYLFAGKVSGEYYLSQAITSPLAPQDSAAPELVDNVRESCTAQIIRLCNDYGRLLGDRGADLQTVASNTLTRFTPVAVGLGQFSAGYYCAATSMQDPTFAVVAGPGAVLQASRVAQANPMRLVAPAVGPVRAPGPKPGVYVVRDLKVRGPFAGDKATEALRPTPF